MSETQHPQKQQIEVSYEVLKPFKYAGEELKPGDEFIPVGSPNDAKLINQGKFIRRLETVVARAEEARRPSKRERQQLQGATHG